jgi:hypothetical protein
MIIQSAVAPEKMRMKVKLAASMLVCCNANRQSKELLANAIIATKVRRKIRVGFKAWRKLSCEEIETLSNFIEQLWLLSANALRKKRPMHTHTLIDIQARIHRLERQNRILIMMLCAMAGVALVAATKHSDSVITATEVRTQRLTLIDNQGKALVDTQGINGVEIRAYLPHNVVQR